MRGPCRIAARVASQSLAYARCLAMCQPETLVVQMSHRLSAEPCEIVPGIEAQCTTWLKQIWSPLQSASPTKALTLLQKVTTLMCQQRHSQQARELSKWPQCVLGADDVRAVHVRRVCSCDTFARRMDRPPKSSPPCQWSNVHLGTCCGQALTSSRGSTYLQHYKQADVPRAVTSASW